MVRRHGADPHRGERAADDYARFDPFDVSQGLQAYADPGFAVHVGGQIFDATELTYLDTDAVATPAGCSSTTTVAPC